MVVWIFLNVEYFVVVDNITIMISYIKLIYPKNILAPLNRNPIMVVWIQWKAPDLMETWSSADLTIACSAKNLKTKKWKHAQSMRCDGHINANFCFVYFQYHGEINQKTPSGSGTTLIFFQGRVKIRAGLQSEVYTVTTRARCHTSMKTQSQLAGLLPSLCPHWKPHWKPNWKPHWKPQWKPHWKPWRKLRAS